MLEDRDYMRGRQESEIPFKFRFSASIALMIILTVAFALQQINDVYFHWPIIKYLALSNSGVRHGFIWQLITFQFLHANLYWHLFGNLIGIWFFGRFIEDKFGKAHFLGIYFGSGVFGGLFHLLLGLFFPNIFGWLPVVGASAGVFGLLAAFCILEPDAEILLFFVLPIKAKYILISSVAISGFFIIVPSEPGIAHTAHFGGILAGIFYIRQIIQGRWFQFHSRRSEPREFVATNAGKKSFWRSATNKPDEDLSADEFLQKEVDPILEKISAHGIHSLTARERETLEKARAKMAKR